MNESPRKTRDLGPARAVLVWLALAVIAIFNAVIREAIYAPFTGETAAHQISTVTAIIFSGIFVWIVSARWRFTSRGHAWRTGLLWLAMTVAFEFGFGRFVMGHSWSRLFHDYDLAAGRVWALFLAWILVMPAVIFRIRRQGYPD
jgi:hypothetical protein